jgi:hypothetical protein
MRQAAHASLALQVLVCRLLRLPSNGSQLQGPENGEEDLVPGHLLVEAITAADGGAYAEAAAALGGHKMFGRQ